MKIKFGGAIPLHSVSELRYTSPKHVASDNYRYDHSKELESFGEMFSMDVPAGQITLSGSRDSEARLATRHDTHDSSGPETRCAFRSQAHADLRAVSSTQHGGDIQQCALFDGRRDNARVIGVEFVVSEKIFSMWPEDEKLLWHAHDVGVEQGPLSSAETQEIADTYGRVFPSSQSNMESALPLVLSQLLTSSSDPGEQSPELTTGSEKPHVSFAKDEVKPQESTRGSEEGIMPGEEKDKASYLLELDGKEDEYLNDVVHRPVVHHRASHMPALTDQRIVDDDENLFAFKIWHVSEVPISTVMEHPEVKEFFLPWCIFDLIYSWPLVVDVVNIRELAPVLIESYNLAGGQGTSVCGKFLSIRRAWATVDDTLFMWRFDKWYFLAEYCGYDQVICDVGLAKARPRLFVEAIQCQVVLANPVECKQ